MKDMRPEVSHSLADTANDSFGVAFSGRSPAGIGRLPPLGPSHSIPLLTRERTHRRQHPLPHVQEPTRVTFSASRRPSQQLSRCSKSAPHKNRLSITIAHVSCRQYLSSAARNAFSLSSVKVPLRNA